MGRPKGITNKQLKQALKNAGGFYSKAAEILGTSHQNIQQRVNRSPELKKYVEGLKYVRLDLAETMLMLAIKKGDFNAIKFYLQCHGADRGYIQLFRNDVSGKIDHHVKIEKIERVIVDPDPTEIEYKSEPPVVIDVEDA